VEVEGARVERVVMVESEVGTAVRAVAAGWGRVAGAVAGWAAGKVVMVGWEAAEVVGWVEERVVEETASAAEEVRVVEGTAAAAVGAAKARAVVREEAVRVVCWAREATVE
jgi:hypothetical protein